MVSIRNVPIVMVVEDEIGVATLMRQILEERGYDVIVAADGDLALRLMQERGTTIDAVVLDIMLPHIHGLDLTTLIQGQWPQTKIVVCSGQLSRDQLAGIGAAYLAKPFTPKDLLTTLHHLGLPPPIKDLAV